MNRLSDSISSSLSGVAGSVLGVAASAAPGPASESVGGGEPAGFARVFEQIQQERGAAPGTAGGAEADGAGIKAGPSDAVAAQAAQDGALEAGRQEIAAGFALQWAALVGGSGERVGRAAGGDVGGVRDGGGSAPGGDTLGATVEAGLGADPSAHLAGLPGWSLAGPLGIWTAAGVMPPGLSGPAGTDGTEPPPVDSEAPSVDAMAALPPVVAWQLSPQLAVITSAPTAAASDEALLAYAAGQGFDPVALQRMLGAEAAAAQRAVAAGSGPGGGAAAMAAVASSGVGMAGVGTAAATPVGAAMAAATAASASAASGATGLMAGMMASAAANASGPVAPGGAGRSNWSPSGAGSSSLAAALAAASADAAGSGGQGIEALRAGAGAGAPGVGGLQAVAPWSIGSSIGSSVGLVSNMPALAALQGRALGQGAAAAAGAGSMGSVGLAPLDGALAAAGEFMATDSTAVGAPGAAAAGTPLVAGAESGVSTSKAEASRPTDPQPLDLRAHLDHDREVLARRVGEALAARILAQVERGEWQIRLSVAPEQLGPIDIDLQVRGTRMEAQFQVANSQTQSLIQDGVARLRDAVGASGMDLASVWVSGGGNERDRGNPTPGQPDGPAPSALNEAVGDEQTVDGVQTVDERRSSWTPRQGALDILI